MQQTPERPYRASHPWISFHVDLSRAGADVWMLLGEARSKVEHLALALLKPEVAEYMNLVYLTKGAQATTAIEGNTLSEEEVEAIVAGKAAAPQPSQQYLYQEVENVLGAFNRIKDDLIQGGSPELSVDRIKAFNTDVLVGLDGEGASGQIRRHSVVVGRYRGAPWEDCEYLLERLSEWLNSDWVDDGAVDRTIPFALIKAIVAHLYIAWIHPFEDGNGRTARLMELQILLAAGVPMPAAHLLSNHYNATRSQYYARLEEASANGGDILPFLRYALEGFVDGIRMQVQRVWVQNYADRWEQFVYETFGGHVTSDAERRRLQLVLAMSETGDEIARRDLPMLRPELAVAYDGTERTLSRDLNALEKMGLIEATRRGHWQVRMDQILAFRPVRRESQPE